MSGRAADLVLRIRRQPDNGAEVPGSARFGPEGGTVGRSARCDLVLPDQTNLVSRQHFEIACETDGFTAVDTSANGLFVNGAADPVGQGNCVTLKAGDRLGVGDYELIVDRCSVGRGAETPRAPVESTLSGNPFAEGGTPAGNDGLPEIPDDPPGPAGGPSAGAERDPFGVPDDLAPDPFEAFPRGPDADWQRGDRERVAPSVGPDEDSDEPLIPEDYDPLADIEGRGASSEDNPRAAAQPDHAPGWRAALSDVMGAPQPPREEAKPEPKRADSGGGSAASGKSGRAAAAAPDKATTGETDADARQAFEVFCRAAGLDPADFAADDPKAALERAGAVFGAMSRGTFDLLQARAAFKEEFRAQRTMLRATDNNPLKFATDAEQAVALMLDAPSRGYMAPEHAVGEAFDDIKDHEVALVAAMHRALSHVLQEFEPDRLESRLQGLSFLDMVPGGRRARYWDLYRTHYAEIARSAEDIFEGALGREFVAAYEAALKRS